MKKILFLSFLFLFNYSLFSQNKFETYNSSYFNKDYSISIAENDNKSIDFYIQVSSMDKISKDATLLINSKNLEEFKSFIIDIKETYKKWCQTATENKVAELNKNVEYKKLSYTSAFLYGKWHFDFSTDISANFRIINDKYLMIVKSDQLNASGNQYIKSDGFVIVFNSEKEFDDFLSKLDIAKATNFFAEKISKEDLFKK
jgi:hypothetical protein